MSDAPLARQLDRADVVAVNLGAMLGAGVFVVFAPAAAAAGGPGLLAAVVVAGVVAYCNAVSSSRLAVRHPESGGTYVYGRQRLHAFAGFLAGWGFVAGQTAACAALALTVGAYLWPAHFRQVAALTVLLLAGVNLLGIRRTARTTRWLVAVTLAVLAVVTVVGATAGSAQWALLTDRADARPSGVLTAAGLLFFAFVGFTRIATLGEEVREPSHTIPRMAPLALGIAVAVYALVAAVALAVLGPRRLASAGAPLAEVVAEAGLPGLGILVRVGATVSVVGVLLALSAGVGRTVLAMARRGDLPGALAAVHPRRQVPHRAELIVAAAVIVLVALGDVRAAVGFASFTMLVYFAITNVSALTLGREPGRRLPVQSLSTLGLVGSAVLAATLPVASVVAGLAVLAVGAAGFAARHLAERRRAGRRRAGRRGAGRQPSGRRS